MAPPSRRKRRTAEDDESNHEIPQTQRRCRAPPSESEAEDDEEGDENGEEEAEGQDDQRQIVKKFVRYALACEYQRIPIRRAAVVEKVFAKRRVNFKKIFDLTQKQLRTVFGMAMVELPSREKVTLKDRREASKKKGGAKAPASYILTTILPPRYRVPTIMPPSSIGSPTEEAQYVGLCTTIVAIIALSPEGKIMNSKLETNLKRLNVDVNMPMETTQNIIKKMTAQGYIVKVVERNPDEETIEWIVGPRGMTEIGKIGIQNFVKKVYNDKAPEDLSKRLNKSLGLETMRIGGDEQEQDADAAENGDP